MDEASNEGLNSEFDNDNEEFEDDDFEDDYENRISNADLNNKCFGLQNLDNETSDNKNLKKKRNDLSRYTKKRKCRTTFTKSQLINLEKEFTKSNFISNERIDLLIDITGLDARIIKNWFKNKRSRVLADTKSNPSVQKTNSDLSNIFNKQDIFYNETSNSNNISMDNSNQYFQPFNPQNPVKENSNNETLSSPSISNQTYSSNKSLPFLLDNYNDCHIEQNESFNSNKNFENNKSLNLNPTDKMYSNNLNSFQYLSNKTHLDKIQSIKKDLIFEVENKFKETNKIDLVNFKESSCNICLRSPKIFCICNVSKTALNKLYKNPIGFNNISAYSTSNEATTSSTINNSSNFITNSKACVSQRKNDSKTLMHKNNNYNNTHNSNNENENLLNFENEISIEKILEIL